MKTSQIIINARYRNLSIPDTRDKLIDTLRWRDSFNVESVLKEDFPQDVFGSLAHISGTDKDGRLVMYACSILFTEWLLVDYNYSRYNIYGGNQDLKPVFGDVQRFIRSASFYLLKDKFADNIIFSWRVALMEKSVMQLDFTELDQMIQVHGANNDKLCLDM